MARVLLEWFSLTRETDEKARVWPMSGAESGPTIADRRFSDLTTVELHGILRLRSEVFVVEQACIYLDIDGHDTEPETRHVWISGADETLVAYARRVDDGPGRSRIGRVVTAPSHRSQGHAARLVSYLVGSLEGVVILDAQSYLLDWYTNLGFAPTGDEFLEDGIPHIPMRYIGGEDSDQ